MKKLLIINPISLVDTTIHIVCFIRMSLADCVCQGIYLFHLVCQIYKHIYSSYFFIILLMFVVSVVLSLISDVSILFLLSFILRYFLYKFIDFTDLFKGETFGFTHFLYLCL
jgi:hypothetical protein